MHRVSETVIQGKNQIVTFGTFLRRKIKYSGLTQQYIADQMHVSPTTVYYWASNRTRPNVDHLHELEEILTCQPGELFVALAYHNEA